MELIKVKQVMYTIYSKPDNIKMSDWTNFWKDKLDKLNIIHRYPASHAGESPFKDATDDDMDNYVYESEIENGDEATLSIEFTSEEALSIADPHYGFMSDILGRVLSKSNYRKEKQRTNGTD
tara:strand:- start:65 stop:430 length:366 start_codon:yes stop_codon:yes gene_type:complete